MMYHVVVVVVVVINHGLDEAVVVITVISTVNCERHGGGIEQNRKMGTGGRESGEAETRRARE